MLGQWRELLTDDIGDARRVLRELLEGPLRFTPLIDGTRRGYRFEGVLTIGGILGGSLGWRPRADALQGTHAFWRLPFADVVHTAA